MKTVLVIEDDKEMRENTAEMLELANYKVLQASNGKEGIELVFEVHPDLIICNMEMPGLDGFGVLHLLRKNENLQSIPFIILSEKGDKESIRKGMDMGADDFIIKPFEQTELLNAVEARLKKIELIRHEFLTLLHEQEALTPLKNTQEVLHALIEGRNVNKYKKKQIIYTEGNRPSRLYYILKGKVKAYKSNDEGKQLIVDLFNEGDFLGYIALLEGTTYKETTEALEDSDLAVIPKEDFEELLNTNFLAGREFTSMIAKKFVEKEGQLVGLAYNSLRKKVAEALLTLDKKYHSVISLNRDNLAAIAGTATESLIRTLADFKNEHLIDIREGKIIILNEKKLSGIIN
ncbi:MAG TPA: response regulator [Chitinophagaceae bacterium]